MGEVDDLRKKLLKKKKKIPLKPSDFLSSGSTLVNLACSGRPFGAVVKGKYFFFVGDSSSGKTWFMLTILAEASINPNFADYRFIYDASEDGALMDISRYFGEALAKRLEPPAKEKDGSPRYSGTIEEFYFHADDAFNGDRPCIYILDSMDALSSEDEEKKFQEQKKAYRKRQEEDGGEKVKGSFGDGKAKKNSANIRRLMTKLRKSGSVLIIVSQSRDNVGTFTFEKKTRSGGRALKFYATAEMWTSVKGRLRKKVRGKDRQVGIISHVQIKKNRITGKEWSVDVPLYHSYGIDDVGSCVDFLLEEKHWKKRKGTIIAPEFDFEGSREDLINKIEEENLEKDLQDITGDVWKDIEDACTLKRKSRYQ